MERVWGGLTLLTVGPPGGQPSTRVTEVGVASRWDPWDTRGGALRHPGHPKKTWREAPSWGNRAKCGEADSKSAEGETARLHTFITDGNKLSRNRFSFCLVLLDTCNPFALQSNFRVLFMVRYKVSA